MENPVFAKAAFRERLRVVLERVWWWLCTCIAHRQTQVLLHQNEIHMRAAALNRARLHITRHAKPLGVSTVTKPPQLFDRDVIALALLHPGVGKIAQHHQDQNGSAAEFQVFAAFARHKGFPRGLYPTLRAARVRVKTQSRNLPVAHSAQTTELK